MAKDDAPRRRGEGRIFRRWNRYWIGYYARKDGRSVEIRESAGKTEAEAARLLRRRLTEVAAHQEGLARFRGPAEERVLVTDLLSLVEKDYKVRKLSSLPQLLSRISHLKSYFIADKAVGSRSQRFLAYIEYRRSEGAADSTVNREIEVLQRGYALAVESGQLSTVPTIRALPEHNARQGFFERSDFEAVVSKIRDHDVKDFLQFFYVTGMRPGEIRSLTWQSYSKEDGTIRLHERDSKTGFGRAIPVVGLIKEVIDRRVKRRRLDSQYIFHRRGKRMGEFRKTWATACKAAGLEDRRIYDIRRTSVRNMVRAGVDATVAMRISGHRTRQVFDRYNIVSDADLRAAVETTTKYVENLPGKNADAPVVEHSRSRKRR
ncbi:MAG TPA: site-specific integrase [Thermoanaerobaculia bacterium]|nr:site-specific integrase [Thermoanaerobaculia bacterium]